MTRPGNLPTISVFMRIVELFSSIQGESTHAGRPCTFVRTGGCDQRCSWCDTDYAFEGGEELSLEQIYRRIDALGVPLVELTGGEPLLQPEMPTLLTGLCDRGYEVLLETGGSLSIARVDPRVKRIVDLKAPASGMSHLIHWENLDHLTPGDELKIVIANQDDYRWACQLIQQRGLAERATVLLSPAFDLMDARQLAEWIMADRLPVRMQLQMHKFIWSPVARGV